MRKILLDKVNLYLSNLSVMYFKVHNLHWNVVGPQFKEVHTYLEEVYEGFATKLDDVAEIIKKSNEYPFGSMRKYLENATISELEDKDFNAIKVVDILLSDTSHLKHLAQEIRGLALEEDMYLLVNMMEEHVADYSKTMWFLFASQK